MPETFPLPKSDDRTYGDYVGYYMSGVEGLRAGVGALEQYYGTSGSRMQAVGAAQRNRANIEQQQVEEQDLTPAARELLQADIGSPSFWAHPIGWGIARTAQSAPYLFASLAPIAMSGGSGVGLAAGAIANGAFSAGDITNSWMRQVDSFSSDQLAELSPSYAEDIINGVSEDKARENLIKLGLGNKPVVATLLGIATTYLGLGGAVAGAAERVAGKSILPRMAGGVLKGSAKEGGVSGVGEAIQTAGEDLAVQSAAQETGVSPNIDYGQTVKAALTGFAIGGPLGAVAGGVSGFGHGARSKTEASEAKPSTEVESEVEIEANTTAQPPPAVAQAIPTTQPTAIQPGVGGVVRRPSPDYVGAGPPFPVTPTPKPEAIPTVDNKVVLPDPLSPTPEQTAALRPKVTPPQVTPPQVTKPQVTPPNVTRPTVTPPNVTRPDVTAPQVTPPQVTRPDVTRPEVTPPQVTPPQVTPPQVTRPEVTPPNVTAPTVTTPTVSPTGPVAAPPAAPEAAPAAAAPVGPSGRRILSLARERTTPVKKIAGRGRVVAEKPRPVGEYEAKPAGRILEDLTAKERNPEAWAKYQEDQVIAGKRRAEDKKAPLGPVEEAKLHAEGIRTGKIGKPAKLKLEGDEQNAGVLFDRLAKGPDDAAETTAETQARVKDIVKLMDDNGIAPGKVTDVMANHMLWLRTAQELHKKFEAGKATPSHIATFISNEREAKAGDFTSMRDRSGGETASRAHHDVELLSDEVTPSRSRKAVSGESEQITDVVSKGEKTAAEQEQELQEARNAPVSKSKSKSFEKAEALPGKHIEITPELRAKYEGVSKFAEEVKPAEPLQEKVTEPEPVVEAPKAAEIKEKVKAKKVPAKEKPAKVAKAVEAAKAPKKKVAPKAEAIKAKAPKKEAAPKAAELKAKKKAKDEAIKEKLQKYIGAEIGDTITMSRPVGYASAGVEYEVLGITSSGIQVQNTATGSRTILSPNELAVGERANTIYSVDKPQVTLPSDPLAETVEQSPAPAGWTDVTGGGNTFAPVTMRDRFGTDNKKEIIEKHFNIEGVPLYQYSKKLGKLPLAGSTEFANRLMERINSIAGGVKVYELTSQQMRDIESSGSIGFYNNKHNIIYLDKDFTDGPNLEHLLLHEGVHAAFIQIMNVKPEIRAVVTRIAQEFKMELERISGTSNFYAFRNVDEFLAEALSNWTMRRRLIQAQASANLRSLMKANAKLSIVSHIRSLWDALRTIVSKSLGFKDADTSLFDAIMHVSAELEFAMEGRNPTETSELERNNISFNRMVEQRKLGSPWDSTTSTYATFPLKGFDDYTKAATQLLPERFQPADKVQVRKARMIWAMDSSHLAQSSKYMGGEKFHASTTDVVNLEQQIHTRALELIRDSEPFQLEYTTAEKNNMGPVWDEFAELIESESNSKTNIAEPLKGQKGISKNALIDVWPKAQHAKLHPRWKAFAAAHPDLAKLRTHALAHFKKAQEQMQYGVLKNRMAAVGVVDDVLMTKLFKKEEELTPEEIKRLGGKRTVNLLQRSPLTSYKGPYYPQFRIGEFVTSGKYKVTLPSDAKAIGTDGNVFEYSGKDARKRAMDFTAKQEYPTTVETTWVDPITNETFFEDLDPEGDSVQIKAGPSIPEAEKRFRVRIENSYMKMHDSLKLAQIDAAEAKLDPNFTLDHLEPRRFNMSELPNGGRELMSHEIRDVLDDMQKHPNWDKMTPIQREELKHLFITLSLNTIGNTRIQNRMRPRRRVQGASRNVSKVWTQYIKSTAGYNAKLEIQPQLDDAVGRMRELAGDKTDGANEENFNIRRTIANELERRVTSHRVLAPVTNLNKNIHRIQAFTFHNYLMSPSYVMNGLLQQPMLTMPTLIAEHGYGATFRAIGYATAKLQPHKTIWQGMKATVKAAAGLKDLSSPTKRANYLEDVITRLNTGEKEMLQYVAKNGGVAPDAGLEISNILGAGWGDQLLEKVTNVARTLPQAVETVNRVTTGIAAYKLAIDKGWSQEKAQQHALEIINRTQFNYSNTNMPPFVSKHPIIGQFKKYGIGVYNLYGYNLGKMAHATTGAERLEAIHALALLTASHALFAGAMGVVGWEPARWLVIGANQAGLVDFTWADVEHGMRELAADALGPYAAELLMKGLPRALGIDISGRVGGSSLLTFSEPRDTDDQSLWAYIGDMVAGAPGGTAMETLRGVNEMMHGDFAKGAQKAAPFKILADVIGAARGAVSGKQTAAGYQVFDPTGFISPDFIAGVLGYQTARHAETSEQRSYFYDAQARASEERNNFLRDWYNASPNKKASVWKDIVEFNRGRAKDEQVTMGDLNNYSKRRKAQKVAKGGVVMTRRNKALWQGLEDTYATQGYFGE